MFQHAVVPLSWYPEESSAGGAVGARAAWIHYRGGGGQTNHPYVVKEVPQTHTSREFTQTHSWLFTDIYTNALKTDQMYDSDYIHTKSQHGPNLISL